MDHVLGVSDASHDAPATSGRIGSLDALRGALVLLVVLHHTAIAYGAIGGWFYREVLPDDSWGSRLLVFFCTVNQAFFMGLFFLLAGYFTPQSLQRKGAAAFLKERAIRLGLPLLVFGFLIGPSTIALARTARGVPFIDTLFALISKGTFEPGPLWFCEALLLFSLVTVICNRWLRPRLLAVDDAPSNRLLLSAALVTGIAAFAIRLAWPVGTQWHSLQLGYFASYVVLFVAGMLAASNRWIEQPPSQQVVLWRRVMWFALPVLPVLALSAKRFPSLQGAPEGGWTILALAYAFWEPFVAWGVILALLDRATRQVTPSAMWRALSERAYTIFVIHPPVVVAVTLALHDLQLAPILKFVLAGLTSCALSFLLAGVVLHLPGAKRVL